MLPSSELKVNITVSEPEISTKAVKSGWASGDKINVWFDRTSNQTAPSTAPDAILIYDGSSWSCSTIESAVLSELSSTGYIYYFYEGYNNIAKYSGEAYESAHVTEFKIPTIKAGSTTIYATPMILANVYGNEQRTYTYDSGNKTLDLDLKAWSFCTNIQVVVYNMPLTVDPEMCTLKVETSSAWIYPAYTISLSGNGNGGVTLGSPGPGYTRGFVNNESTGTGNAVEFHLFAGNDGATDKPTFILSNGNAEESYTLTSDMTFTSDDDALQAYKLDYNKFGF